MTTRVALLRGINVGRGNRIAMADLRACLGERGFREVETLLASGNVIFDAPSAEPDAVLAERLRQAILERFELDVRILVLDGSAFESVLDEHPWRDRDLDPSHVLVMLPTDGAIAVAVRDLESMDWGDEEIFVGERAVYLHCPQGMSQGELAARASRSLGPAVTARNWRTLMRIVDSMASRRPAR